RFGRPVSALSCGRWSAGPGVRVMTDNVSSERSIFESAIEKQSPEERAALLAAACGDDRRLREGVEALLAAHDRLAPAHPPGPAAGSTASFDGAPADRPGAVVGPYRLMEQIGEGGMGLVFVAEQTQPVRRKVALKVIKPGMDTRAVVARFEAERQALALLGPPPIAQVLAGGRP